MKANSSFPHPVLGINKGVLSNINEEDMLEIVSIEEKDDSYEYTFKLYHDNTQINDYIKMRQAKYICEVDCSKSFFKITYDSYEPEIVVSLKKKDVVGHVDFSFFIVTSGQIKNYRNPAFNHDYKYPQKGTLPGFDLDNGAVLAMFPQFKDNVTTRFNGKPELNAFIQVVKRKDTDKSVEIDLGDDIINIELPEELYIDFIEYNREQYRGIFYTSLIFNALVKAILNMDKNEGLMWVDSINAIVESMPEKFQGLSLDDSADAVDIATKMLTNIEYGSPYDLLFSSIKNLQN